jgi:hypothetical protein
MLAQLPTVSSQVSFAGKRRQPTPSTGATWLRADPTQPVRPRSPVAVHDAASPLGVSNDRPDDRAPAASRHRPAAGNGSHAAARPLQETRLDLPDAAMLPLGASRRQLEQRLGRFLSQDLYAGLCTDRNARQFDAEIGRIASRLASLGLEPEAIRELYEEFIHQDDHRALILEKVLTALPYQAASWVAAQFGLPALAHLPLFARSGAVALATAAFDEGAQGLVRGTAAQKHLAHHRPEGSFPPLLRRQLLKEASESGSRWGVCGQLATATGGVTLKNAVRTGLSVGAAALGMSNAAIGAVGAVTDLVGGTGAIARVGVRNERKDRRAGLQWLLAFDGAPSVLKAAAQARQAAPMSMGQRAAAAGGSALQTARQAVSATPQALRAVFGPGTLVKAAGLTVINALGELGTEHVKKVYGERVPTGDLSARRRRADDGTPSGTGNVHGPDAPTEASAEPTIPESRLLKGVLAEQGIAAALALGATPLVEGANEIRKNYDGWVAKTFEKEGLRRRIRTSES